MTIFYKILEFIVYGASKILFFLIFKIFYGLKVIGKENIPEKGGVIIVANHASFLDPPLVGIAFSKRKCVFMARHTLFKNFIFSTVLKMWGTFPIKRGAIDRKALNEFENKVKEGYAVIFFPEGTRTPDGEIKSGKPGAGMLIYNSKVNVIPVYIHNSYKAFSKNMKMPKLFIPITVIIGKPINFNNYFNKEKSRELYEEITEVIMNEIKKLKSNYLYEVKK